MILGRPDTIIVVAPELVSFYEFVKPRQEAEYGSMVVLLDRRSMDRPQVGQELVSEPGQGERRTTESDPARAQLSVLGFAILHRAGERYTA